MRRLLLPLALAASCGVIDQKGAPGWQTEEPQSQTPKSGEPGTPGILNNSAPTPKLPASCDGKSIMEVRGGEIWKVGMDGSERLLHSFVESSGTQEASRKTFLYFDWKRAGEFSGFVATFRTTDLLDQSIPHSDHLYAKEIIVLDGQGLPVFHAEFADVYPKLFLSEFGDVAIAIRNRNGDSVVDSYVVRANGTRVQLGIHAPIMHPVGGKVLVADDVNIERAQIAWYDLDSGEIVPMKATPSSPYFIHKTAKGVFYHSTDGHLVLETPSTISKVAVGSTQFYQSYQTPEFYSPIDSFVLISDNEAQTWRVNLQADPIEVDLVKLPEHGPTNQPGVRDDGVVFATEFVDEAIQAVISHDLGATWTPVGEPILPKDNGFFTALSQLHAGDSVLVTEVKVGYGYYLESVQGIHSGNPVLTTHANGFYTGGAYSFNGMSQMSADGGCAVLWRLTEPREQFMTGVSVVELTSMDFATGDLNVLRTSEYTWNVDSLLFPPH